VTTVSVRPANAADAEASSPAGAGFVAFVDGAPWSTGPVRYQATLEDNAASALGGSKEPREISLDVARPEDGERIVLHLKVVSNFVDRHALPCRTDGCRPAFEGQLYRNHNRSLFVTKAPSTIEILKDEPVDARTRRLSLWFDLRLEVVGGAKGQPVHIVGTADDAEVADIGGVVGLLAVQRVEMRTLSVDHLPAALRPKPR
jgi:hypothetical protein